MLQALLHDKLARYLCKSPYEIEDLLTSVVFGSCAYAPHELGLLPFLGYAKNELQGYLRPLLGEVESVGYDFWPEWRPDRAEPSDSSAQCSPDFPGPEAPAEPASIASVQRAQPELLLRFSRRDGRPALV